jgi:hypothetical protein
MKATFGHYRVSDSIPCPRKPFGNFDSETVVLVKGIAVVKVRVYHAPQTTEVRVWIRSSMRPDGFAWKRAKSPWWNARTMEAVEQCFVVLGISFDCDLSGHDACNMETIAAAAARALGYKTFITHRSHGG